MIPLKLTIIMDSPKTHHHHESKWGRTGFLRDESDPDLGFPGAGAPNNMLETKSHSKKLTSALERQTGTEMVMTNFAIENVVLYGLAWFYMIEYGLMMR